MEARMGRFREQVAQANRGRKRRRFDSFQKSEAAAISEHLRGLGWSWLRIGEALEVSPALLQRWSSVGLSGGFVRLELEEESTGRGPLRLCNPKGYEVHGLDVESAAALLRLLS